MPTIQSLQDSIDIKADAFATSKLKTLSTLFKQFLVDNIDSSIYTEAQIYEGLSVSELLEQGSPAHKYLHHQYFIQEQSRLITLALTKLT